jgi:hypothetical protein
MEVECKDHNFFASVEDEYEDDDGDDDVADEEDNYSDAADKRKGRSKKKG